MKHLLSLLLLMFSTNVFAQDVIVKTDGGTIIGKIIEVSSSEVKYKKYSNLDGPTYTISASSINVINFANGEQEDFGKKRYDSGVEVKRKEYKDWNTVYFQYNPSFFYFDSSNTKWDKPSSFKALTVGYSHAFNIIRSQPLYLEPAIEIQYSFGIKFNPLSNDGTLKEGIRELENPFFFSIRVPINFIYKFNFSNERIALAPFAGLYLNYNPIGFVKAKYDILRARNYYAADTYNLKLEDEYWFIFSKSDMGKEYEWKTFQIGFQIGANVLIKNRFKIGASYGSDFMNIFDCSPSEVSAKIGRVNISLGYVF